MKCKEGYEKSEGDLVQTCDWRGKWPSSTSLKCEGMCPRWVRVDYGNNSHDRRRLSFDSAQT